MTLLSRKQSNGLLALVILLLVAFLTAAFWEYTQDDVFITYVYSRNLIEGNGFVFNPGERVQGTTTPLQTFLMAGVHLITDDLLHAGNLLSAIFLLITIWLALKITGDTLSIYARAAMALVIATSPLFYVSFGMETLLYCALLMLAFWLWNQGRREWAMIAAGLLTWTRADGVVLGGTLWLAAGIAILLNSRKGQTHVSVPTMWQWFFGEGLRLGLIYAATIAPWYLFAWAYFGSPLPNTFGAKQEFLGGLRWWTDGWALWKAFYGGNPITLLAFPLIPLGLWRTWIQPCLRSIAMWAVLYGAGYTSLNVTAFWYYTPWVATLIMLAAFGGDWLARWLIKVSKRRHLVIGLGMVMVLVATAFSMAEALKRGTPPGRVKTYVILSKWIYENTSEDSTLLIGDLGIMGYHARRHTIDSPGLIVQEMYFKTDSYATAKYKTDLIVGTGYYTWVQLTTQDWFKRYYRPLAQFSTPGDEFSPMTVYGRRYPLENPTQVYEGSVLALNCMVQLDEGETLPEITTAHLRHENGEIASKVEQPFLMGQYPQETAAGDEILNEQIVISLNSFAPGTYNWKLTCDQSYRGEVAILPIEDAPGYTEISVEWENLTQLEAVAFPEGLETWSGGSLPIVLHWSALNPEDTYSVFVHVRDANGRVWGQADGLPQGEVDWREIQLLPDTPAGEYTVYIGWYDWQADQRFETTTGMDEIQLPITIHNRWSGGSGLP